MIIHYIVEKNIFRQCLQAFSSEERLKCHIKDFFKINGKPKIVGYIRFKNYERKIPFMIYADFESILVPRENREKNLVEFYANKYQKYVACSCGYSLVFVDDKFSKPVRSYLGVNPVYNFINSMIEES